MAGIEEGQIDNEEQEQQQQQEYLNADGVDVSGILDDGTEFDVPRSDVIENEHLIGTPGFGDGDLDEWRSEEIQRRLERLGDREMTALKKRVTYTKKKILTKLTGQVLNKGKSGTLPFNLYENMTWRFDVETRQPNGVRYNGVLVMVRRGDNLVPYPRATIAYPNFMRAVREASGLPETTNEGQVFAQISEATGQLAPEPDTVDSVRRDLARELEEAQNSVVTPGEEQQVGAVAETEEDGFTLEDTKRRVDVSIQRGLDKAKAWRVYDLQKRLLIDGEEAREILGAFQLDRQTQSEDPNEDKAKKIETLQDVEIPFYEEKVRKATQEGNGERAAALKEVVDWCELESDRLLSELNRPMQHTISQEVLEEVVENNEQVTLEKVKKFLKENGLALAGVGIMLASFATAVVSLVKSGARAVKGAGNKVADAFKKIAEKLGPILGPLFSLVGSVFGLLAKGVGWLGKNLWVLLLFVAYLIYDYGKWKFGK